MTGSVDLEKAIQQLSAKVPTIVVKRGRHGARVYQAGRNTDVASLNVMPVDTIGAGDSFDAGFPRAYLLSKDVVTCARAGNITGALSTQGGGGIEAFVDEEKRNALLSTSLTQWPSSLSRW